MFSHLHQSSSLFSLHLQCYESNSQSEGGNMDNTLLSHIQPAEKLLTNSWKLSNSRDISRVLVWEGDTPSLPLSLYLRWRSMSTPSWDSWKISSGKKKQTHSAVMTHTWRFNQIKRWTMNINITKHASSTKLRWEFKKQEQALRLTRTYPCVMPLIYKFQLFFPPMSFIQNSLGWIRFYICNNNCRWSINTGAHYEKNTLVWVVAHTLQLDIFSDQKATSSSDLLGCIIDVFIYWIAFDRKAVLTWKTGACLFVFFDATRSRCFQRRPDITTCSGRHSSSTTGRFSRALQTPVVLISGYLPHCSSQWRVLELFSDTTKQLQQWVGQKTLY